MITVEILIADKKKPPVLKFGERCVNCGQPKHIVMPLKLTMGVQKRGQGVLMDFPVPLCADCERKERRVTNVTLVPFTVGGLLLCGLAFIPAWLLAPTGETVQTLNFDVTVGTLVGIVVGLIGGTALEFGFKLLFAPVYGRLLLKRPLTVLSLFNDSEDVIGLSAKFTEGKRSLMLTFENDEIGREFKSLNS
jgi:hypothetical protein